MSCVQKRVKGVRFQSAPLTLPAFFVHTVSRLTPLKKKVYFSFILVIYNIRLTSLHIEYTPCTPFLHSKTGVFRGIHYFAISRISFYFESGFIVNVVYSYIFNCKNYSSSKLNIIWASPPRLLVGFVFKTWSECSPQCLVVQVSKKNSGPSTNMAAVGHLWFFLLSHLLRNYLTDSNETCLLCSPQCLVLQVQKKFRSVDQFGRLVLGSNLVKFPIDSFVIASLPRPLVGFFFF